MQLHVQFIVFDVQILKDCKLQKELYLKAKQQ